MSISVDLSLQIKEAIKTKLMELESYVDNELPEYIMIMVANRKSQMQMTDDLSLFLNDKTATFTSWLNHLINNLDTYGDNAVNAAKDDAPIKMEEDTNSISPNKSAPIKIDEDVEIISPKKEEPIELDDSMETESPKEDVRSVSVIKASSRKQPETIIIDDSMEEQMPEETVRSKVKSVQSSRRIASVVEVPVRKNRRHSKSPDKTNSLIRMALVDAKHSYNEVMDSIQVKSERDSIKYSANAQKKSVKDRIGYFSEERRGNTDIDVIRNQLEEHVLEARRRSAQVPPKQKQIIVNINDDSDDEMDINPSENKKLQHQNKKNNVINGNIKTQINKPDSGIDVSNNELPMTPQDKNRGDHTLSMDMGNGGVPHYESPANLTAQRCFFFPNCRQPDRCPYFHPTTSCRNMASCRFGASKCRYIHQTCRFDQECTNSMCHFMHSLPKQREIDNLLKNDGGELKADSFPTVNKPVCQNGDTCKDMDCKLIHPRVCRYGISCRGKETCSFIHPELPNKYELKWSKND